MLTEDCQQIRPAGARMRLGARGRAGIDLHVARQIEGGNAARVQAAPPPRLRSDHIANPHHAAMPLSGVAML